ncbi:MAG: hypothetical protein JNK04_14115 [Myxococcales bacterium]|nr:hypothetical protein [Myxococcales bacterium]
MVGAGAVVALGAANASRAIAPAAEPPPSAPASEAPRPPVAESAAPPRAPAAELAAGVCTFPDKGTGDYAATRTKPESGAAWDVIARDAAVGPDGAYDLLLHVHGGEAARKIIAPLGKPLVVATLDRGDSSGDYGATFPTRKSWDDQVASIDRAVSDLVKRPAHASRLAISSFSAGYGATREALVVAGDDPALTGVLLLDSLYGSYAPGSRAVDAAGLEPFEKAGRRALEKPRFSFILTHSEVPTDGYASTAEVATTLLDHLVVRANVIEKRGPRGLMRVAEERGFVVRGYGGNDKGGHCAHLALLPELVDLWRSRL